MALRINDPSGEIASLREYRLLSVLFFLIKLQIRTPYFLPLTLSKSLIPFHSLFPISHHPPHKRAPTHKSKAIIWIMAANSLWCPMNFLSRPRIETRDATTTYITVTATAPIIYAVVTVTVTAESGNSQLAAPAHGEHTILSVAGEAPSTPWSIMVMSFLSSIPTEILGSASGSASTVSATRGMQFGVLHLPTTRLICRHLRGNLLL